MKTRQDYSTPPVFLEAVAKRFGRLAWDLACNAENRIAGVDGGYAVETADSLALTWKLPIPGNLWLNPPFANIDPWAQRCAEMRNEQRWTLMLTPASIGTAWFAKHVQGNAFVLGLAPRLTFVGETMPYPKDLMLVCCGFGVVGFDTWRWDQ